MRKLIILVLVSLFISCEKQDEGETEKNTVSSLDLLFSNEFSMSLEQVYACVKVGSSYQPIDSVFRDNQTIAILPNYAISGTKTLIMDDMVKGETWVFGKPIENEYEVIIDNGGVNDPTFSYKVKTKYTPLKRYSPCMNEDFRITYYPDDGIYGKFQPKIKFFTSNDEYTNLVIEQITHTGTELVLKTNSQYILNQNIFPPLTSQQVRIEIANRNYSLYLQNGNTYYKIGENLYKPSFNGGYVYVGSTNSNGLMNTYYNVQYYLKFKLL